MEFKTDEANLRDDSNQKGEIDLYDELVAFSNLSPEDQSRGPAPRLVNDSEPDSQPAGGFVYADLKHSEEATVEPVRGRENQSSGTTTQTAFELIDRGELQRVEEPPANPIEDFPFELPYEPVAEADRKSSFEQPQAGQPDQGGTGDLDLAYLLRVTGPLVALGMTVNSDSPLLVCKDCRSQSSSRDMFCVTCGGLLESAEVAEAAIDGAGASGVTGEFAAARLACDNCDYVIEEDEIFCPSCGAST
jgi:RNA polymerase subunit RPABC4/transcription elongation factor Spt4